MEQLQQGFYFIFLSTITIFRRKRHINLQGVKYDFVMYVLYAFNQSLCLNHFAWLALRFCFKLTLHSEGRVVSGARLPSY